MEFMSLGFHKSLQGILCDMLLINYFLQKEVGEMLDKVKILLLLLLLFIFKRLLNNLVKLFILHRLNLSSNIFTHIILYGFPPTTKIIISVIVKIFEII